MTETLNAERRQHIFDSFVEDLKNKNFRLPSLPTLALKIRQSLDDPKATTRKIAQLLQSEPVLAARLLQVANGAIFAGLPPVNSMDTVLQRLGLTCVRNIVLSVLMRQAFNLAANPAVHRKMQEVWQHSAQIAATSQILARHHQQTGLSPEIALLCGLLHNIGALPILARCADKPHLLTIPGLVDDIIHNMQAELGGWLLEHWQLEPELCQTAREHQNLYRQTPDSTPDYVDLVLVAQLHSYRWQSHPWAKVTWTEVPAFQRLSLEPEDSLNLLHEARSEIQQIRQMLS